MFGQRVSHAYFLNAVEGSRQSAIQQETVSMRKANEQADASASKSRHIGDALVNLGVVPHHAALKSVADSLTVLAGIAGMVWHSEAAKCT